MRRKGWKGAVCVVLAILLCGCSSGVKIVPIESLSPTSTAANVYVPKESPAAEETQVQTAPVVARIEDSGMTIGTRINPPMGYTRVRAADGSLGAFLRTYPVKSAGSPVMLYDGTERTDAQAAAVLDIVLGKKNHEGPAGTAARLLSEYLYSVGNYKDISFRIGSKFSFSFDKWRKGNKLNDKADGWVGGGRDSNDEDNFKSYLTTLFVYISMSSLEGDIQKIEDVDSDEIEVGDLFIGTNAAGKKTCLMVADLCQDDLTGERLMLLVQGGAPAQQAHIVANPADAQLSPWYPCNFSNEMKTPDVTVKVESRYRFKCLMPAEE